MADELVDMSKQFQGLDFGQLIAGPLLAACDAQTKLAKATTQFITEIGFEAPAVDKDGKPTGPSKTRQVEFTFKRPVQPANGAIGQEEVGISAPLLAIVPVPALRIETVTVDFNMEVKSSFEQSSKTDYEASLDASFGWGPFSVKIHGQVAAHQEQTRKSDNSAKYAVHVEAKQAAVPEGLMKILDMLNTACQPSRVATTKDPGGATA